MKVQFDQNGGFSAQMNHYSDPATPDLNTLKKGLHTAKNHTALLFGILALVIVLALLPYVLFLDVSADIVELFSVQGFQSAQELDQALEDYGIPFAPGEAIYTLLSTINLSRCMVFLGMFGLLFALISITFAILSIVMYTKNTSSRTSTAGLVLSIVSLVLAVVLVVVGLICIL